MAIADRLKTLDTQSSVSKEFRVYTLHGAILSIITVAGKYSLLHNGFASPFDCLGFANQYCPKQLLLAFHVDGRFD